MITSGLVFHYDLGNAKSYMGPPVVNLVPGGDTNGFPKVGNGWGTYQTNQYNAGVAFSIGSIASVSGNLVTTVAPHPLRTFDAVQPQTTGGGLTISTNYYIRKWSSTTFSVHLYNNSENGTYGFQAIEPILNDTRVTIDSTNFPTMWWGYPHLPNSGLIKTIIPNGFNFNGRVHDCLRMHYYRPDGVIDYMAYGVTPWWEAGKTYTISFYHRTTQPESIGKVASISRWTNGDSSGLAFVLSDKWQKCEFTTPCTQTSWTYFYFPPANFIAGGHWDVSEIMSYEGDQGGVEYTPSDSPRTVTSALKDLTGNSTIDVTNAGYNTSGNLLFNGSSNYIKIPESSVFNTQKFTIDIWFKPTVLAQQGFLFEKGNVNTQYSLFIENPGNIYFRTMGLSNQDLTYNLPSYMSSNTWCNIVAVLGNGTKSIYHNTSLTNQATNVTGAMTTNPNGSSIGVYGGYGGGGRGYYFNGQIPLVKVYDRALTHQEIKQNFIESKSRFGI